MSLFESILKKNNTEIFISETRLSECPIDGDGTYTRSVTETGYMIRTLKDNRLGTSTSNIIDKEAIKKTAQLSLASSTHAEKLPKSFSFTDTEGKTPVSGTYDNKISKDMDTITAELKKECQQTAAESGIILTNGKIKLMEFRYTIMNSLGIEKKERGTYISAAIDSKADTKKPLAELSSTYIKRTYKKSDFRDWFKTRLDITKKCISPQKLKTASYNLILSPQVAGPVLLDTIGYWASGKSRLDGISLFEGKENKAVASQNFTATDDPTYPDAPSTFSIDMEGTKTKKTGIIKNGIFSNYIYDNKYSSHANTASTGNCKKATFMGSEKIYASGNFSGMHNLSIKQGTEHLESLLSGFSGIYIEAVGIPSADHETGNFGFELRNAFLVDKGAMTPVRYAIYSGKVQDLIRNTKTMSKERETITDPMAPEYNSACITPYFLIENQKISAAK